MALFSLASIPLLAGGALSSQAILRHTLYGLAEQGASRDAQLLSEVAVAAAASDGKLSRADFPAARREFAAVRQSLPLIRMMVWPASGPPLFGVSAERLPGFRSAPEVVEQVLRTGKPRSASGTEAELGATVQAAVLLAVPHQRLAAYFEFSRRGLDTDLAAAEHRQNLIAGLIAILLYAAIVPLMVRIVRRLPRPVDPVQRAAAQRLQQALSRREICLHYQPKIDVASAEVVGFEALVRWEHPERGLLSPGDFLSVAEANPSLLAALTTQVLDGALRACARWRRLGQPASVAVNVPAAVLLEEPFAQTAARTLQRHNLAADALTIEITESAVMQQSGDIAGALCELRAMGITISIDDFGTGHSSLARLNSLPLDELKIDRSFVSDLLRDPRDLEITSLIIALATKLGLATVAEGVEDEATLQLLHQLGCTTAQGFHIARPLSEDTVIAWLQAQALIAA